METWQHEELKKANEREQENLRLDEEERSGRE
jgi:hypothetical protein